jgi:hypothetical protein
LRCRLLNPATINVVVIAVSCIKTTPYGPPCKHAGAVEDCDVTAQLVRVVSCPECSFVLDHHGLSIAIFARMPVVNAIGETFYIALGGLVMFFALSVTIIETGHASTGAICCAFRDRAERNQKCNNRAKHHQRTILVAISCYIPRVCHDDLLNQNDPT